MYFPGLFDFLLQSCKQRGAKEFLNRNTQSVAKFLDRRNGSAIIPSADNIVHGGLRNTADAAELVNGDVSFLAQLNDSLPDSFAYGHRYHLFLSKMIPLCT